MTHPDAPRYITDPGDMLDGWTGPVDVYIGPDSGWIRAAVLDGEPVFALHAGLPLRLDPYRPEVRDLVIRRRSLPAWVRGLPEWKAAGVVALGVAGGVVVSLLGPWRPPGWSDITRIRVYATDTDGYVAQIVGPGLDNEQDGWMIQPPRGRVFSLNDVPHGPETGPAGQSAADAQSLAANCILDNGDHLILPWPGGARVWRRDV